VKYIDAGYVSALSALFLYAVMLFGRRRRLERVARPSGPEPAPPRGRPSAP